MQLPRIGSPAAAAAEAPLWYTSPHQQQQQQFPATCLLQPVCINASCPVSCVSGRVCLCVRCVPVSCVCLSCVHLCARVPLPLSHSLPPSLPAAQLRLPGPHLWCRAPWCPLAAGEGPHQQRADPGLPGCQGCGQQLHCRSAPPGVVGSTPAQAGLQQTPRASNCMGRDPCLHGRQHQPLLCVEVL